MWCCLFFNFIQFVIVENLSTSDLALSRVKGVILLEQFLCEFIKAFVQTALPSCFALFPATMVP